ncbi:MAG: DNA polymerase III subunit chi [Devosia sp.]|jgi:DNA polymerase-3 subunit chi|uniref:DNA polymerase III subunit chi n=1 Tax=unclassified Devosia TaxID=196773 RepID=UPI001A04753A|nr:MULTISPECIES: DNA polymerase III subunit chi [unclassified Devosia]MBF0679637.1 DNA polymerase III subunit chi [Devosia sp.]WEJ32212.1 DNA polymerase III subunit chi [Devosia sp. SD17-2]
MAEVLFYHLEVRPLEAVLPQLLEKTLERGWRAVVECGSRERAEALDAHLWTFRDDSFLAHGLAGDEADALQPILLTTEQSNPNNATVRFFVDRAVPHSPEAYQRLVYMFSGHDPEAVAEARQAWRELRAGNTVTYWQQEPDGRWSKKA